MNHPNVAGMKIIRSSAKWFFVIFLPAGIIGYIFVYPIVKGSWERYNVNEMFEKQEVLISYLELLGEPYRTYQGKEFESSEASSVFGDVAVQNGMRYFYWAKEGFPYYWILIIYDPAKEKVEDLKVKS